MMREDGPQAGRPKDKQTGSQIEVLDESQLYHSTSCLWGREDSPLETSGETVCGEDKIDRSHTKSIAATSGAGVTSSGTLAYENRRRAIYYLHCIAYHIDLVQDKSASKTNGFPAGPKRQLANHRDVITST